METNKEQHDSDIGVGIIKHTPEPLIFRVTSGKNTGKFYYAYNDENGLNQHSEIFDSHKEANDHYYSSHRWLSNLNDEENMKELIKLLLPYRTACEGINPDNPMAVAESLREMLRLLKGYLTFYSVFPQSSKGLVGMDLDRRANELLIKIQSK